jgi:pimeloyl-ACP methyl ester carboxylesterase
MQIEINDTITHYQKIGTGTPLVLLHGWGCDWQIWSPVITELSKKFQLIIPDLPVFGQSDIGTQIWNSPQYAQWLSNFIDQAVGKKKFILAGHSFGGKIAALYAAANSDSKKLKSLILIDAAGLPVQLTTREKTTQQLSGLLPKTLKKIISGSTKKRLLSKVGVASDYQEATAHQQAILRKIVREDISDQLVKIDHSTLIIWGVNDDATPIAKGRQFASLIDQAQLETFNTGHYPFVEDPQKFIQTIINFTEKK